MPFDKNSNQFRMFGKLIEAARQEGGLILVRAEDVRDGTEVGFLFAEGHPMPIALLLTPEAFHLLGNFNPPVMNVFILPDES